MLQEYSSHETDMLSTEELISLTIDAPVGIFKVALNENFNILYGNATFYNIIGYSKKQLDADLSGNSIFCFYEEGRDKFASLVESARTKEQSSFKMSRIRIRTREGELRWVSIQFSDLLGKNKDCNVLCGYVFDITEQKKIEEFSYLNQERYRIAISMTKTCVWEYDIISKSIFSYEGAFKKYGFSEDIIPDIPNTFIKSGFVHPDYIRDFQKMYLQISNGRSTASWLGKTRNETGSYIWTKHTYRSIFNEDGKSVKAIGISEDVDATMNTRLLYQKEILYRNSLIEDSLINFEFNLTKNLVIQKSIHTSSELILPDIGQYDELLILWANYIIYEEDSEDFLDTFRREYLLSAYQSGIHEIHKDYRMHYPEGTITWVQITIHMILKPESNSIYALVYIKDIQEKKIHQIELEEKAERDLLTHLYNRATVQSKIETSLILSKPHRKIHALIMLDIDNFKYINDTFGHDYGDYVLCEIGRRLDENFRDEDILGRFGGDEFMLFIKDISSRDYAKNIGEKICSLLQFNCVKDGKQYRTSSSAGIVIIEAIHPDFPTLYKQVDEALYAAKHRGKNQYCIYAP